MTDSIKIGEVVGKRGERVFGRVKVCDMPSGSDLTIPVHIISGAQAGPKLCVMTAQHGDEVKPIASLMEVARTIKPAEMKGDLVLIPVANPIAFEFGTRCTWVDGLYGDGANMNRMWPGRSNSWLTQLICWTISQKIFAGSDCILDLHDGSEEHPGQRLFYGYMPNLEGAMGKQLREISLAFGMEILMEKDGSQLVGGTLSDYAVKAGIAHYACELGDFWGLEGERSDPPRQTRWETEVGVTGITNVMKYLGMLPGEPVRPRKQVAVTPEHNIRPSCGGVIRSTYGPQDIGRVLPKGTVLAEVLSPHTFELLEEIRAPFGQSLLIACPPTEPIVRANAGDYAYILADWGTAKVFTA